MEGRNDTLSKRNSMFKGKGGRSVGHSRNCRLLQWVGYRVGFREVIWLVRLERARTYGL